MKEEEIKANYQKELKGIRHEHRKTIQKSKRR
jgi:hypothetical protein